MSFRDLPRLPFSMETELPTPKGFISSCEMMEALLAIWWQHDLTQLGIELDGYKVEAGRRLGNAATSGQHTDCASLIRSAGLKGELEAFVPIDPSNPDSAKLLRIGRADWAASGLPDWQGDLIRGHVFRFPDGPTAWANGKQLCFLEDQAENWLRGLRSPHLIPDPIKMDSSRLPERPYIYLSECVTWLAGMGAMKGDDIHNWQMDGAVRIPALENGTVSQMDQLWDPGTDFNIDRWFASHVSERIRYENARGEVLRAMASGRLIGRGRKQSFKTVSEVRPIPAETFQLTVELKPAIDSIGLDSKLATQDQDGDAFLNGANWKDIRFARHDLISLWGADRREIVGDDCAEGPGSEKRVVLKAEAEARYRERVENWPEGLDSPTRDEDARWRKEELGLPRERARELREAFAPEWTKPGRRKKTGRK